MDWLKAAKNGEKRYKEYLMNRKETKNDKRENGCEYHGSKELPCTDCIMDDFDNDHHP